MGSLLPSTIIFSEDGYFLYLPFLLSHSHSTVVIVMGLGFDQLTSFYNHLRSVRASDRGLAIVTSNGPLVIARILVMGLGTLPKWGTPETGLIIARFLNSNGD